MAFVITQRCCNDASCVSVCPVDCIRPTPEDPNFLTTEMLHIDPGACVDCGACVPVCPTNAIRYDTDLSGANKRYADINAAYFQQHPLQPDPGRWDPDPHRPPTELGRLRIAIVGAGAAACYAAEELLDRADVEVDLFDRLPTPYGLIRGGVAPDHADTKDVSITFGPRFLNDAVALYLNVEVGEHITHDELMRHYHAVIYAVGAFEERRLEIPGEDLPGSHPASDFVGWYNGHPDFSDLAFDLSGSRAVVVGNGNVALDIARILLCDPDHLQHSDIADHALDALRSSAIREVLILGRRGPLQAAYSSTEFLALGDLPGVDVVVDPRGVDLDAPSERRPEEFGLEPALALKMDLVKEYAHQPTDAAHKRIVFRYCVSPTEVVGTARVEAVRIATNELVESGESIKAVPTSHTETVETSLLLRSIGFRGRPLQGLPFEEHLGLVPNERGRVVGPEGDPIAGVYVAGWIKRGATGTIGTNKHCARETVNSVLDDFTSGRLASPEADSQSLRRLLAARRPTSISKQEWRAIDQAERRRGAQAGRPRTKFTTVDEMVDIAKSH